MDQEQYHSAAQAAAGLGNRRLLFAVLFQQFNLAGVLAEMADFRNPDDPKVDDDHWVWLNSEIQAKLEEFIEKEIDLRFPGYAWEYHAGKNATKIVGH